jgi:large subunit ribosomal protein L49
MRQSLKLLIPSKSAIRRSLGHPALRPAIKRDVAPVELPRYAVLPIAPSPSGFASSTGVSPAGLPFSVLRTHTQGIPVYSDYKNGRTRVVTILRKIDGDAVSMREELQRVLGGAKIALRTGYIEIEGNRVQEVKTWLAGLGF